MTAPFNYFLPYQQRWITDRSPLSIAQKSRRIGFTYAHAYRSVEGRLAGTSDYWHSSADESSSVEFIRDCETFAKIANAVAEVVEVAEVVDEDRINTLQMKFSNGRKIVAGTSNPKFFRSKGGEAGLDEFAFHTNGYELYKAAHATAMFRGYPLRIFSTHNGEGSFFNSMLKMAEQGRIKATIHTVTVIDAVEQGLVEQIKGIKGRDDRARQEWIDELRATCVTEDMWNEEYMCKPSSDQTSLLSYDLIRGCESDALDLVQSPEQLESTGVFYAGYDVGRHKDLSVLWVLQRIGDVFHTRMLRELSRVDYTAQEGLLNTLMANRSVKRLCIDSTGIGGMLAERQRQRWGHRAEGVNFSAPVKEDLAMPLLRLFQDRLVRVPAVDAVREDLHKVRKIVTASNNLRLDADRDAGGHADRFWALSLAYHAAGALKIPLPAPSRQKLGGF